MKALFKIVPVIPAFLSFAIAAVPINEDLEINSLSQKIESEMQFAKNCLPKITKEKILFCTGAELPATTLLFISDGGVQACSKLIEEKGYSVVKEGEHQKLPVDVWNSFYQTTKWAETIHSEKYVFLKKIATRVDCLHEYIHVLQWTSKNKNPLAPVNRKKKSIKLSNFLMKASDRVAKLKDTSEIKKRAEYIQSKIKTSGEYEKISSWLDEKDAYFLLYNVCDKQIKCSDDDWDTIIGNLYLFKDKLPWKFRNEIIHRAARLLRAKEEAAIKVTQYVPMDQKDIVEINSLQKKSVQGVIDHLTDKKIQLYKFVLGTQSTESKTGDKISRDIISTLNPPDKVTLDSLLAFSKIGQSFVLGKFLCTSDNKDHFIILTENSSKEVIIHEYMHYLQSLKNPGYCDALTSQNVIYDQFKTGKISRQDYETKILAAKVLIWKTEQEVYKYMSREAKGSELENINNKIQNLIYDTRLTKTAELNFVGEINFKKLTFKAIDDLPFLSILGGSFVLDLGAMDSVMSPQFAFEKIPYNAFSPIKMKSIFNSFGESVEAPEVLVNSPIEIDGQKILQSRWIIANLKIPDATGVVGLNFFKGSEFILYPKNQMIEFVSFKERPKVALFLQRDYDDQIRSVEFICPDGVIARLDSGSQITGDTRITIPESGYRCGPLKIKGQFNRNRQNEVLFSHGVSLNLGWPWMKQFNKISISLKDAWISFE